MKRILIIMSILGLLAGCRAKQPAESTTPTPPTVPTPPTPPTKPTKPTTPTPPPTMPEGRLKLLTYNFSASYLPEFSDFRLELNESGDSAKLSFRYAHRGDMEFTVSDTLLNNARDIIERDSIFAYDRGYGVAMDGRILDGYHWDLFAFFEGKKTVSSRGRHAMPDGDGLRHIREFFEAAAQKCIETIKQEE